MAELKRLIEIGIDARKAQTGGKAVEAAMENVRGGANLTRNELGHFQKKLTELEVVAGALKSSLGNIFGGLSLAAGVTFAFTQLVKYEDILVDVQNTVGDTTEKTEELVESLVRMSTVLPRSTAELAEFANAGSKLGIDGVENLTKFAEDMTKVGLVTDLRGEQGAKSLARLAKAAGEPIDRIKFLGAAVNVLVDEFGAADQELVGTGTVIAQLGARFGVTSKEALAIAAALSRVGVESGSAGIVISRLLDSFSDDFVKQFGGGSKALVAFIEGLARIKQTGGDVDKVLESLGFTDRRLQRVLIPLIAGHDELSRALDSVSDETAVLNNLEEEAERKIKSSSSQLTILKNEFFALTDTLITGFGPALTETLGLMNSVIRSAIGMGTEADKASIGIQSAAVAVQALGVYTAYLIGLKAVPWLLALTNQAKAFAVVLSGAIIPGLTIFAGLLAALLAYDVGSYFYGEFKDVQLAAQGLIRFAEEAFIKIRSGFEVLGAYIKNVFYGVFDYIKKPLANYIAAFAEGIAEIEDILGYSLGSESLGRFSDKLRSLGDDFKLDEAIKEIGDRSERQLQDLEAKNLIVLDQIEREFAGKGRQTGRSYYEAMGEGLRAGLETIKSSLITVEGPKIPEAVVPKVEPGDIANLDAAKDAVLKLADATGKAGEEAKTAKEGLKKLFDEIRLEQTLVGKTNDERERAKALQEVTALATKAYAKDQAEANKVVEEYLGLLRELQKLRKEDKIREANDELDKQIGLIGTSIEYRKNAAEIIKVHTLAEEAYGKGTREAAHAVELFVEKLKLLTELEKLQNIIDGIGESISQAFEQMVFDAKNFQDALEDVVKEISRLVFQQLVTRQIANAISGGLGSFFGPSAPGSGGYFANGGLFRQGSVVPFASGGLISEPTYFPMSGGRTGLMGEAGPELLLRPDMINGRLGLRAEGGGGSVTNVNMTVYAQDVRGFKEMSTRQIGRKLSEAVRRAR